MRKEKELISVVIPAYNRANCIEKCLKSVLSQTYQNMEVIVVDDGSSDTIKETMSKITDTRVHFFSYEPNQGACYARNYGAEHAKGTYIAFQDSDDTWRPEKLEKQLMFLRTQGADMVFCAMNRIPQQGKNFKYPVHAFENEEDALTQILYENRVSTQTMFMKREVWETVRFDVNVRRYQDWEFALRVARSYKLCYQDEIFVDSEVGKDSISNVETSLTALENLLKKNQSDYEKRPQCMARMYRRMGRRLKRTDKIKAKQYFYRSFQLEKNVRNWLGYMGVYFLEE